MTDPQVWTLIGVFTTIMLGAMTLMTVQINRTITASIGGLRGEMKGRIDGLQGEMNARFEAVEARFEAVDARFEATNTKIDHLDREVAALSRRLWDGSPGD